MGWGVAGGGCVARGRLVSERTTAPGPACGGGNWRQEETVDLTGGPTHETLRQLTDAATRKVHPEGLLEGVTVVYADPAVRAARKAAVILVEPDVQQLVRVLPAVALQVERHC